MLYEAYRDAVSAQAQQIADDFRRAHALRTRAEGRLRDTASLHPVLSPSPFERESRGPAGAAQGVEGIVEQVLAAAASRLTASERAVLKALPDDGTLEEIAQGLRVTRESVVADLRSAYLKLGGSTRTQATAWVRRHGIT